MRSPSRTRARPLFIDRRSSVSPLARRTRTSTCPAKVIAGFQVATRPSSLTRAGIGSGIYFVRPFSAARARFSPTRKRTIFSMSAYGTGRPNGNVSEPLGPAYGAISSASAPPPVVVQ